MRERTARASNPIEMPDLSKLESLEAALRRSVLSDSFAEAQSFLSDYVVEFERLLDTAPGPRDAQEIFRRMISLLDSTHAFAEATRHYACSELAQVQALRHYQTNAGALHIRGDA